MRLGSINRLLIPEVSDESLVFAARSTHYPRASTGNRLFDLLDIGRIFAGEDHEERDENYTDTGERQDSQHVRDLIVDRVREFAVNSFDVVRVDNVRADQVEDKGPDSEASNDDARNEAWAIGEPKPAVLHRDHVSQAIANTKSDRKEADERSKSGDSAGHED